MIEHVTNFVRNSGGIDKVDICIKAMTSVADHQDFLRRLSNDKQGARQFFASALLGLTLASAITHGKQNQEMQSN